MLESTYILPIRRQAIVVDPELTRYLAEVSRRCRELIVVDGSDAESFEAAHREWSGLGLHVRPDPARAGRNGKVPGVLTGIALANQERLVIADDDVRYDEAALERAVSLLDDADVVRPQSYFGPLVWHARWDTARTLLNRVVGGVDFPGTLALRKSMLTRTGGYDADVLFENLELIRTVEAAGGRVLSPPDLYVRRLPPSGAHFWSQRVRQAYDEFARPWRLVGYLSIAPLLVNRLHRRRYAQLATGALGAVLVAEFGRRRAGGKQVFPVSGSLFAPVWIAERSVCSWLALGARLRGGCLYTGVRLKQAANSKRELRRRLSEPGLQGFAIEERVTAANV
jgi:hypothetical protein